VPRSLKDRFRAYSFETAGLCDRFGRPELPLFPAGCVLFPQELLPVLHISSPATMMLSRFLKTVGVRRWCAGTAQEKKMAALAAAPDPAMLDAG